jgi:hypothetical protein
VFSTVLGVYLAAHAAPETTIRFEALCVDRDSYYVRTSRHNEFSHNISVYEEIINYYRDGKNSYDKNSQLISPRIFCMGVTKSITRVVKNATGNISRSFQLL